MISSPHELNLPYDSWRDTQLQAFDWISKDGWLDKVAIQQDKVGKRFKVKVLEAPTGTGKTGIALGIARQFNLDTLILCATKIEQTQYEKQLVEVSSSRAISIVGKNNYHCILPSENPLTSRCESSNCDDRHVDTAACQAGYDCDLISSCPYFVQRNKSFTSQIVITNYAFGLNSLRSLFTQRKQPFQLIIEDEGHNLHSQLEQLTKVQLYSSVLDRLSLQFPTRYDLDRLSISSWQEWATTNLKILQADFKQFLDEYGFYRDASGYKTDRILSPKEMGQFNRLQSYIKRLETLKTLDASWVVESDRKLTHVTFTPLWMTQETHDILWNRAPRHLIMSGTIPNPRELTKHTGLQASEFEFKRLPYVFPVENRPIIIKPKVNLSYKTRDANLPKLVSEVDEILDDYPDVKGLIHTHNYVIAKYIMEHSKHSYNMVTHDSKNRNVVLRDFKTAQAPRYLVSPSMEEAIDLPGDMCEFIIIAKLPFPMLGSKIIKSRFNISREWYENETLTSLIQMAGRGVRTYDDICPVYVIDYAAKRFLSKYLKPSNTNIPEGIKEAIITEY